MRSSKKDFPFSCLDHTCIPFDCNVVKNKNNKADWKSYKQPGRMGCVNSLYLLKEREREREREREWKRERGRKRDRKRERYIIKN